jgi:hypothetical protein
MKVDSCRVYEIFIGGWRAGRKRKTSSIIASFIQSHLLSYFIAILHPPLCTLKAAEEMNTSIAYCLVALAAILICLPVASSFAAQDNGQRRDFIKNCISGTAMIIPSILPSIANADGSSANIKMPSYIEFLIEKNAEGIAREGILYQGPNPETQLRRIGEASNRYASSRLCNRLPHG